VVVKKLQDELMLIVKLSFISGDLLVTGVLHADWNFAAFLNGPGIIIRAKS